ncbi:MAG: hypothetical protein DI536_34735 [Archangium gephyra]|uniref:2-dehydropantoate 2-reductase n=1 Tax=Archangium gephyra TaxID=48 RepID=A0A2W5STN2_9BACT|nr:MAG: hypothetical protein DI536_34735 [Archangium gephyra]
MRTLIVGAGALGGVIGARLLFSGVDVSFATRDAQKADQLRARGLRVTGCGPSIHVDVRNARALDAWSQRFELIILATKAHDVPDCAHLLAANGTLLPIQNGITADRPSSLGGLSNLGATMLSTGDYEQRNFGHLLLGALRDEDLDRAELVGLHLRQGIDARVSRNIRGAMWSKLLINCSVTTIGALAGTSMRGYIELPEGRALFDAAYDEALTVAQAAKVRLEPMVVDPRPPADRDAWVRSLLSAYGDLQPSMLQDLQRGRPTEIDVINGAVVARGRELNVPVPVNTAITERIRSISRGATKPSLELLRATLCPCRRSTGTT